MFEHMGSHHGIIVTGPHRSGTTITGRMIAYDLDRHYETEARIQEENGGFSFNLVEGWIAQQHRPWVLHGATCWRWIKQLSSPHIAVVFVSRPPDECLESQYRLGDSIDNPRGKQADWLDMQRDLVHFYTVYYHDLKAHPLWCDDREGWAPRQIAPNETAYDTRGGR